MLAIVITSMTLWVILAIVQCRPISYNWEGWKGEFKEPVKCLNLNILSWTTSAVSIALDTIILIMPMSLVVKVKSTLRRKIAIISMFSLGVIIVIASCLRLRFNILYGDSVNITWDYVDLMIWTGVEVATSITVTSLPSIRLMMHRRSPGLFGRIFAFGGHVEHDRGHYLEIKSSHSRDVEHIGAKGIMRRLRRTHTNSERPPTIGGGPPKDRRASKAQRDSDRLAKPMPSEASRVLASIMGSLSGSSNRPSISISESSTESITVTTEITITSEDKQCHYTTPAVWESDSRSKASDGT
ncbi:hypothetical protein COL922a_008078 [Colletotrichum nupharicola]|nr:hypothetical protein COL922a_008078 [Colletotrichum nupharicola]